MIKKKALLICIMGVCSPIYSSSPSSTRTFSGDLNAGQGQDSQVQKRGTSRKELRTSKKETREFSSNVLKALKINLEGCKIDENLGNALKVIHNKTQEEPERVDKRSINFAKKEVYRLLKFAAQHDQKEIIDWFVDQDSREKANHLVTDDVKTHLLNIAVKCCSSNVLQYLSTKKEFNVADAQKAMFAAINRIPNRIRYAAWTRKQMYKAADDLAKERLGIKVEAPDAEDTDLEATSPSNSLQSEESTTETSQSSPVTIICLADTPTAPTVASATAPPKVQQLLDHEEVHAASASATLAPQQAATPDPTPASISRKKTQNQEKGQALLQVLDYLHAEYDPNDAILQGLVASRKAHALKKLLAYGPYMLERNREATFKALSEAITKFYGGLQTKSSYTKSRMLNAILSVERRAMLTEHMTELISKATTPQEALSANHFKALGQKIKQQSTKAFGSMVVGFVPSHPDAIPFKQGSSSDDGKHKSQTFLDYMVSQKFKKEAGTGLAIDTESKEDAADVHNHGAVADIVSSADRINDDIVRDISRNAGYIYLNSGADENVMKTIMTNLIQNAIGHDENQVEYQKSLDQLKAFLDGAGENLFPLVKLVAISGLLNAKDDEEHPILDPIVEEILNVFDKSEEEIRSRRYHSAAQRIKGFFGDTKRAILTSASGLPAQPVTRGYRTALMYAAETMGHPKYDADDSGICDALKKPNEFAKILDKLPASLKSKWLNQKNEYGYTALMFAAKNKNQYETEVDNRNLQRKPVSGDLVAALINHGADIYGSTITNDSAFSIAVKNGNSSAAYALLNRMGKDLKNIEGIENRDKVLESAANALEILLQKNAPRVTALEKRRKNLRDKKNQRAIGRAQRAAKRAEAVVEHEYESIARLPDATPDEAVTPAILSEDAQLTQSSDLGDSDSEIDDQKPEEPRYVYDEMLQPFLEDHGETLLGYRIQKYLDASEISKQKATKASLQRLLLAAQASNPDVLGEVAKHVYNIRLGLSDDAKEKINEILHQNNLSGLQKSIAGVNAAARSARNTTASSEDNGLLKTVIHTPMQKKPLPNPLGMQPAHQALLLHGGSTL